MDDKVDALGSIISNCTVLLSTPDDATDVDRARYGDVGKNSRRFVSNEQIPLPVRNHIGRTTAETRQQLELKSAAHAFFFFPYGTKFKIEYCRTGACGFGDLLAINTNIYIYTYTL